MKVLVTGGSGVVGEAAVTALVARGHTVRLLARGADGAKHHWPAGVTARPADLARPETLTGAARGCAAILHVAGIERETPPDRTFEAINVAGTRALLAQARREGVRRFVYVSSLGADHGRSAYHRSKRAAERLVRAYLPEWVIVRPGNVYGPGDEVTSFLLKLTRSAPAVPLVGDGRQPFQPIWHQDLGQALALAVEHPDAAGAVLEVAGDEVTSMADLVARLSRLDGRTPLPIRVPTAVVRAAARAAEALRLPFPVDEGKLTMLEEGSVLRGDNALVTVLGLQPTPLEEGLRRLAASLPEQTAAEGVGRLHRKRFWAGIQGATVTPARLRELFLERMADLIPIEGGPKPGTRPREGSVLTLTLPFRGVLPMRMALKRPERVVFLTLAGHPLAGTLAFHFKPRRFEIEIHVRPATTMDAVALAAGGGLLQDSTWRKTVERVVELSGGTARDGVQEEMRELSDPEAAEAERFMADLVIHRKRGERQRVGRHGPAASRPRGVDG